VLHIRVAVTEGRIHVLVATDGAELAAAMAQRGISLLSRPDQVTVLTVITKVRIVVDDDEFEEPFLPVDEQDRQWQAQIAEAKAALARTRAVLVGARVGERIEAGDAGPTICDVARELGVDAIVVGSRPRHGLGRLRASSVTEHVVRHAPCAVLVVRADAHTVSSSPSPPGE
jgi:nucleotide-binding universal stress UspA family protein